MQPMTYTKLAELQDELAEAALDAEELLTTAEAQELVRDLARGYDLNPEIESGLLKDLELYQEEVLDVEY
jgi:hypothetical protein